MSKWKKVKLGDIATYINGCAFKPSDWSNQGVPIVRIQNLTGSFSETNYYDKHYNSKYEINNGDVLISWSASLGVYVWDKGKAILNQHIFKVVFNKIDIDKTYFIFAIKSLLEKMEKQTHGATMKHITKPLFDNMEFPFPAMEEQKKIAARLDAVSDLLTKQKQLLSEQDNLIQSTFYDMFGDPIKNEKGWKIEKFKELGTLERGKSQHRPRNAPELLGGPYPLIQTGDIAQAGLYLDSFSQTYSELGLKQSRLWKKGTLCITIAANIAKTSILNFDACFPDSVVGFINNTACSIMFIQIWMSFLQQILESNAPQAAQKNINLEILGNLDVIVPPLELQQKFAAVAEQIESEKSKIKSAIAETQTLFNALMAEYFEE